MREGVLGDLVEAFEEMFWPTRCVGCESVGMLLCPECEAALPLIDAATACPRCGAPFGSMVCTECGDRSDAFPFSAVRAAGSFEGVLARAIIAYKDAGERRFAEVLARLLAIAAGEDWRQWADLIVFVPASAAAYRRRGFDHMEAVARAMGAMTRLEVCDALVCGRKSDQRLLGRRERRENTAGMFAPVEAELPRLEGADVLLVDDVFTTGATLMAACDALLGASVGEIRVVVAARVW